MGLTVKLGLAVLALIVIPWLRQASFYASPHSRQEWPFTKPLLSTVSCSGMTIIVKLCEQLAGLFKLLDVAL